MRTYVRAHVDISLGLLEVWTVLFEHNRRIIFKNKKPANVSTGKASWQRQLIQKMLKGEAVEENTYVRAYIPKGWPKPVRSPRARASSNANSHAHGGGKTCGATVVLEFLSGFACVRALVFTDLCVHGLW